MLSIIERRDQKYGNIVTGYYRDDKRSRIYTNVRGLPIEDAVISVAFLLIRRFHHVTENEEVDEK